MDSPAFLSRPIVAIERDGNAFRVATWSAQVVIWNRVGDVTRFESIDAARAAAAALALEKGYAVAIDMASASTPPNDGRR